MALDIINDVTIAINFALRVTQQLVVSLMIIINNCNMLKAFITSLLKLLSSCLFNVIGLIPFWEMESTVLTAK